MQKAIYAESFISEKTRLRNLSTCAYEHLLRLEKAGLEVNVPLAIFHVAVDQGGGRPLERTADREPDRLVIVALHAELREFLFTALAEIAQREEKLPQTGEMKIAIGPSTPLKRVFQDMTAQPATALTITVSDNSGDPVLFVFARTAFTISELRNEIGRFIADLEGSGPIGRN